MMTGTIASPHQTGHRCWGSCEASRRGTRLVEAEQAGNDMAGMGMKRQEMPAKYALMASHAYPSIPIVSCRGVRQMCAERVVSGDGRKVRTGALRSAHGQFDHHNEMAPISTGRLRGGCLLSPGIDHGLQKRMNLTINDFGVR